MKRLFKKSYSQAEEWLQYYTNNTFASKSLPNEDIVSHLKTEYPLDSDTPVYRGINFKTKELYDQFISEVQSGSLDLDRITSWTKDPSIAEDFAITTMVDSPNFNVMLMYDEMQKNRERVAGYRGVIVQTVATINNTLVDVTKSNYDREQEVILMPGTISVSIYQEIKTYKDQFEEQDINEYILSINTSGELDEGAIKYILHHHPRDLSNEAKDKIYELFLPQWLFGVEFKEEEANEFFGIDKDYYIAHFYINPFLNNIYPYLTDSGKQNIQDKINLEADDVLFELKENEDKITMFKGSKLSEIEKYVDSSTMSEIQRIYGKILRDYYQQANDKTRQDFKNNGQPRDFRKNFNDFLEMLNQM